MKQALYLIFLSAVLTWTVGCTGDETSERGSEADSLIMQAQNAGDYRHVIEVAERAPACPSGISPEQAGRGHARPG